MNSQVENEQSKKDVILQTTLQLINELDIADITVRKIANRANVNISLVNYYFGTKDNLLNTAVRTILTSFMDTFIVLENEMIDPKERLKQFLIQYAKVIQMNPFIPRQFLHKDMYTFESQKEYVKFVQSLGLNKILVIMREVTGEQEDQANVNILFHLLGGTLLPIIMESPLKEVLIYQIPDLEKNIDLLFSNYFGE